jgi:putative ABC transport system permease protein
MIINYLLLASRNIARQRGYALINALGLAIGLSAAMLILLYVRDERTFDTQHPDAEHTYRLAWHVTMPSGEENAFPGVPAGWDNYIQNNYPGVQKIGSFVAEGMPTTLHNTQSDKKILTEEIIWAEASLRDILAIDIVEGDKQAPLREINAIMLSQSAARDLFGDESPLNQTVAVSHGFVTMGQKINMRVTAVYRDMPSNMHIRPQYICNLLAVNGVQPNLEQRLNTYMGEGDNGFFTSSFMVCTDERQIPLIQADLQKQVDAFIARMNFDGKVRPLIRKITEAHFDQTVDWALDHKSANRKYLSVFLTIALLILVVACINYINLATANSASRAREIGLRKTFGGRRQQLFFQFMAESFLMVLGAATIALLLALLFLPLFNNLTGKTFGIAHLFAPAMLLLSGGIVLLVTLLAGSYPALFVSGFQPAVVLKGKFAFRKGSNHLRQFLTTVQFSVAITLLVGTVVVVRQMNLMRNSKLNEAGRQVLSIRYGGFTGPATDSQYGAFKNELLQNRAIQSVTLANHLPRLDFFGPIDMQMKFPEVDGEEHNWFQLNGDFDFPSTFNMKILAGRTFDPLRPADSSAVLLNESAVRALRLTPETAVGKSIVRPDVMLRYGVLQDSVPRPPVSGQVIGVVEDFPYRSMHHKIAPLALAPVPHIFDRIIHVRLSAEDMGQKIADIERTWYRHFPDFGFDYWFVDEEFGRMYENEAQISEMAKQFAGLALLITCVGLYGLAAFLSQQRTKEIGIRKTLGASNRQVLLLLLRVFGKILLLSSAIGVPIALFLTQRWLANFEYQAALSFWVFLGAILLIGLVTLLTVGYESLRAATANPVESLRSE